MKKTEEYSESKSHSEVMHMVEALRDIRREKLPVSNIQSASTEKLLSISDDEAKARRDQLTSTEFFKDLKQRSFANHPEFVTRKMDPMDLWPFEIARRRPKNSIGQSDASGTSSGRKEIARQTFTCTPPTPLTKAEQEKLIKLEKIKELEKLPPEYIWKPMSFLQAVWHKLKGGEIKQEKE